MCILSVYTLLKVVGYYDLSVLPMSVMGFPKKCGWGGWVGGCVGGVSSIQVFFVFCLIFLTLQSPLHCSKQGNDVLSTAITYSCWNATI